MIDIYTDVSLKDKRFSTSCFIIDYNDNEKESRYYSRSLKTKLFKNVLKLKVFNSTTGEIYSMFKCFNIIKNLEKNSIINIYTDSFQIFECLNKRKFKNNKKDNNYKLKYFLRLKLLKLKEDYNIEIRHIKAHCGVYGNEFADKISKHARLGNINLANKYKYKRNENHM